MKEVIAVFALIVGVLTIGCGTGTSPVSKGNVTFEVREFAIRVDDTDLSTSKIMRQYNGRGTIVAMGDPEVIKRPYFVFIRTTTIKGGNEEWLKGYVYGYPVINGTGEIGTRNIVDIIKGENKPTPPEYVFEVIGYVPITPQAKKEQKS